MPDLRGPPGRPHRPVRRTLGLLTVAWIAGLAACVLGASLSTPAQAATPALQVVTEELPPYNMTRDGRLTGMSTEVVQAVLKDAGIEAPFQSLPWARAYEMAQSGENVLIYSIARTPQREKLFKWVGAIAPTQWALYARADRGIVLHTLDDARGYQIATVNEDVGEQYLVQKGFVIGRQLQSSNRYEFNHEKLLLGRVDLWISNELNAAWHIRQAGGRPGTAIVKVLDLPDVGSSGGVYMALSVRTSDAVLERLRRSLEHIRRNGVYDDIRRRWL
ncbi:substrate-binding periplasmic protein [Ideonella sp.]|uniref:substrate-binding periplasmic protein n=1 Tax=Ideonella sp. TaxID=1929293 RepID=UPI0035B49DE3